MAEKKNIFETINAVMEDVGVIGKDQKNQQQGFMYRGIDDVMNALNPAFIKHRLFIVPEVLEQRREERQTVRGGNLIYSVCRVKYTFHAEDGSSIEAVVIGEGMDSGDKASNKALAVAFKYACFQVFCIPTEEMKDPDAECHETAPKADGKAGGTQGTVAPKPQNDAQTPPQNKPQTPPQKISEEQLNLIMKECDRTGVHWREICKICKVEKLSDMTVPQYKSCVNKFKITPDRKKEPASPTPEVPKEEGVPWNTPAR